MTIYTEPAADVLVKLATKADVDILCRFIRHYYAFDHISYDAKSIRAGLKILLKKPAVGRAFLIVRGVKTIGYTIVIYGFDLEFGGRMALVTDLYLEPRYRGAGIGRRTMEFIEGFCRKAGIKVLELQSERRNARAKSFYESCGFRAHDRVPMSKYL